MRIDHHCAAKTAALIGLLALAILMCSCNTVEGLGEDLSAAGEELADVAEDIAD